MRECCRGDEKTCLVCAAAMLSSVLLMLHVSWMQIHANFLASFQRMQVENGNGKAYAVTYDQNGFVSDISERPSSCRPGDGRFVRGPTRP